MKTASTDVVQTFQFGAGPAASTTARSAQFSWSITGNPDEAPVCVLDPPDLQHSPTKPRAPPTGATLDGRLSARTRSSCRSPDFEARPTSTSGHHSAARPPGRRPSHDPVDLNDLDGDGIDNTWLVGGKAAPAPATPKAKVTGGNVKLTLKKAPKGAKKIRVYRADGKGGYKLVKTLSVKSKSFTDKKIKAGHTYKYKTVAVNAKGQQGAASKTATVKVKKTKKK